MTKKLQVPKVVHRNSKSPFTMSGALGYTWHTVQHMRTFPIVLAFKYYSLFRGELYLLSDCYYGLMFSRKTSILVNQKIRPQGSLVPSMPSCISICFSKDNRLYPHTRYYLPAVVFLSLCLLRN